MDESAYRNEIDDYFWHKYEVSLATISVDDRWTIADAFKVVCQRWPQDAFDKLEYFTKAGGNIDELYLCWIKALLDTTSPGSSKLQTMLDLSKKFNDRCVELGLSQSLCKIFIPQS